MQIRINSRVLSIPPFISTTWSQIDFIRQIENKISVNLKNGEVVNLTDIAEEHVENIFEMHADYLEKNCDQATQCPTCSNRPQRNKGLKRNIESAIFSLSLGPGMDGFQSIMQHNQDFSDAPDLPSEVLTKICEVARATFGLELLESSEPVLHCNCFHCQIVKAVQSSCDESALFSDQKFSDELSDMSLDFDADPSWIIEKVEEKLYSVINPLNIKEQYNVFLGKPVGCTCGIDNCEHILAVLRS